jgi:hypothetical protein
MLLYVFGVPLMLLGLLMFTRGLIYTLRPDGPMALKRKQVNLRKGFPTDMKRFGRRVRRLGFIIALMGTGLVAWQATRPTTTSSDAG